MNWHDAGNSLFRRALNNPAAPAIKLTLRFQVFTQFFWIHRERLLVDVHKPDPCSGL